MRKEKIWPEVFVDVDFLKREDIIEQVAIRPDSDVYDVIFEHPVFGRTLETFELDEEGEVLMLKFIYPMEIQDDPEVIDITKDYYNNYLLDGEETYIEYFEKSIGYFLLSRNIKEVQNPFGSLIR